MDGNDKSMLNTDDITKISVVSENHMEKLLCFL